MPFRIAIDVRRIRDFGIGTYIRSLIHALGTVDAKNHYTLIASPADARTLTGLAPNFETAVYKRRDDHWMDHVAFPAFLHSLGPQLVHVPLNRVPLFMIKPYVVTVHDMANLLFEEDQSGVRMSMRRYRFRRGLIRADRVIAVSEATSREVQKTMNIPPQRIRMVYNAPDPAFFEPSDASARERILERYQVQYPFLLYAGNIRPHKNIPRLVEAFAVVRDQLSKDLKYADLRLIIIGDQISQYPSVRHAVIKSRVENAVRFLGFVPFDTLRCFYESAAAFVFPSLHEGFGLPPLEALASGTPVVCSNVSSLPEVVGDAAVLVNPLHVFDIARGIRDALMDESLRRRAKERGRAQASRFSWERTAREVLEIYREVAGRN